MNAAPAWRIADEGDGFVVEVAMPRRFEPSDARLEREGRILLITIAVVLAMVPIIQAWRVGHAHSTWLLLSPFIPFVIGFSMLLRDSKKQWLPDGRRRLHVGPMSGRLEDVRADGRPLRVVALQSPRLCRLRAVRVPVVGQWQDAWNVVVDHRGRAHAIGASLDEGTARELVAELWRRRPELAAPMPCEVDLSRQGVLAESASGLWRLDRVGEMLHVEAGLLEGGLPARALRLSLMLAVGVSAQVAFWSGNSTVAQAVATFWLIMLPLLVLVGISGRRVMWLDGQRLGTCVRILGISLLRRTLSLAEVTGWQYDYIRARTRLTIVSPTRSLSTMALYLDDARQLAHELLAESPALAARVGAPPAVLVDPHLRDQRSAWPRPLPTGV